MTYINKIGVTAVGVTAASVAALTLAGCSLPTSSGPAASASPTSTLQLNAADAAAIISGSTILSQVPGPTPDPEAVKQFTDKLSATKSNPGEPQVDVGYQGAKLVNYEVGEQGAAGPMCIVTGPPDGSDPAPSQSTWATYFSPDLPDQADTSVLIVAAGVSDCEKAKEVLGKIGDDPEARRNASRESTNFVGEAFLAVPASNLTERGLAVFDLLRVGAPGAASPSASPSQTQEQSAPAPAPSQ